MEKMSPHHFSFEYWRAGSLTELGIETRTYSIERNRRTIRRYAIGYLNAEKLWIRPKLNAIAVMFWFNDSCFWTHLTNEEFKICFPELCEHIENIKS